MRRHIPDVFFGAMLAVAIFAVGLTAGSLWLPRSVGNESASPAQQETGAAKQQKTFWERTTDDPVAFFTLVITIFTGATVISNIGLWVVTGRTLRHYVITAERQLRAYIAVQQFGVQGLVDSEPFGVTFIFVNYGQTPGTVFDFQGTADILPFPLPDNFDFPAPPQRGGHDVVVFPGTPNPPYAAVWERQRWTVTQKQALLSVNVTQQLYVHGVARYTDIFGSERSTEFCLFLNHTSIIRDRQGNPVPDANG